MSLAWRVGVAVMFVGLASRDLFSTMESGPPGSVETGDKHEVARGKGVEGIQFLYCYS